MADLETKLKSVQFQGQIPVTWLSERKRLFYKNDRLLNTLIEIFFLCCVCTRLIESWVFWRGQCTVWANMREWIWVIQRSNGGKWALKLPYPFIRHLDLRFWDIYIHVNQMRSILEFILILTFPIWHNESIQKIMWKSWALYK